MPKPNSDYETYSYQDISEELINSIKPGDLLKINSDTTPVRVKAVTPHYIVASRAFFKNTKGYICEKERSPYTHNMFNEEFFRVADFAETVRWDEAHIEKPGVFSVQHCIALCKVLEESYEHCKSQPNDNGTILPVLGAPNLWQIAVKRA